LRFSVSDTGMGIPARIRTRLFEMFEQGDNSLSRRVGGTGLGMAIAKGLAEAMGGSIGVESVERRGSTFRVELPFAVGQAQAAAEPSTHNIDSADRFQHHRTHVRGMQILVADDHEANRMVLQRLLQKAGHYVTCADNGKHALRLAGQSDYDAVICDLHMPELSGLDLLKQLRVMKSRTPVLIFSADVTPESIRRCERAGARAFLSKPIVIDRLLDALSDIAAADGYRAAPVSVIPIMRNTLSDGDVLDTTVLDELRALNTGETLERGFVAQCLSDMEDCINAIGRAMELGDITQAREHAHALKGVASHLGLVQVAAASNDLMQSDNGQIAQQWRQRLAMIGSHLDRGRQALEARSRKLSS
jgi:two-component system sensor histidine kinase RpfC